MRGGQLLSGATVTGREPRLGTVVTSGDRNRNGMLDPGEIWLFSAIGTVPLGAYTNTATVSATVLDQPTPVEVSASDIAHLLGTLPGIHVDKYLNGVPSGSAASPVLVAAGSVGTYTYRVSATTPASLANVTVIDDNGTPAIATDDLHPRYVSGDANGNTLLDPDETWVFTAQRPTAYGPYVNVVQVTGDLTTHPGRTTVWDDDLNYSLGVTPPDHPRQGGQRPRPVAPDLHRGRQHPARQGAARRYDRNVDLPPHEHRQRRGHRQQRARRQRHPDEPRGRLHPGPGDGEPPRRQLQRRRHEPQLAPRRR